VASAESDESGNLMLAVATACADVRCCPGCGVRSARSLGLVTTRPRDLPLAGRPTSLRWTKPLGLRQYRLSAPVVHRVTADNSVAFAADQQAAGLGRGGGARRRAHGNPVRPGPRDLQGPTGWSRPTPAAASATATPPTSASGPAAPPYDEREDTSGGTPAAATTSLDAQDPDPASSSMSPHIQTRRTRSAHWTACRVPEL
jgi:zinc-finger of transposase IS204/IS1001/IS1096/IS1165